MSSNTKKINFNFKDNLRTAFLAAIISVLIGIVLAMGITVILMISEQPEKFYDISSVILLVLTSFLTAKIYIGRQTDSKITTVFFYSFILFALLALLSLIINKAKLSLTALPITFLLIFFSSLAAVLLKGEKKKKHKRKKH